MSDYTYIYHSRFIWEKVAETQIFTYYQNVLAMSNAADVTGDKSIAV
jgi:hypothetical protein